ncbi:hypothetical protein CYLTODRAFT_495421 [Cylindrobasidium torrendii FP15055 ss-10]|uniref:Uncharacterized protein n=1 Tax=Cylindrobasidium torrendii FP15055 ss-10 TaxID=1314674 RepID=A0A0D7AUV3_9AGAR|nr:hypothetical protein CYLTODRAFT_495421 [Cylindrobasidium torrendii FP15055 ss-10]
MASSSSHAILLHNRGTLVNTPKQYVLKPEILVYAAVLGEQPFIVGSPNCYQAPQPRIGETCAVTLREDVRYHADNPIQWPQWFCSEEPHLACVLRPQTTGDLAALWDEGDESFWQEDRSLGCGIGMYSRQLLAKLETAFNTTFANHKDNLAFCTASSTSATAPLMASTIETSGTAKFISQLHNIASIGLNLLSSTPLPFDRSFFILRILQRICIEYAALVTYEREFKKFVRLEAGPEELNRTSTADMAYMGCFTNNITMVSAFIAARLPVWLVHDTSAASGLNICSVGAFVGFGELVEADHWRTHSRGILYEGSQIRGAKYRNMRDYLLVQMGNFHSSAITGAGGIASRPPLLPPLPSTSITPTSSSRPRARKGPYPPRPQRLILPVHSYLPVPPRAWSSAFERVDANEARCLAKDMRPPPGYFLPRPDLFTSITSENGVKMIFSWLQLRPFVLLAYSTPSEVPISKRPRLGHQSWRQWLNDTAGAMEPQPSTSTDKKRKGDIKSAVLEFISNIQEGNENVRPSPASASPQWYGAPFDPQDATVWREILWELSYLAFRLELQDIDDRLSRWERGPRHQNTLHDVFCMRGTPLLRCDLGMANIGAMDLDWRRRAQSIWALKSLMEAWTVEKPEIITSSPPRDGFTLSSFADFEAGIAHFYIDTYFRIYGRAPILPAQLSHTPPPSRCTWSPPNTTSAQV